jgi:hypothetical protein
MNKEVTYDSEDKKAAGAIKYDGGKAPVYRGGLSYFYPAIESVSAVSGFGASKYAWNGWRGVDNGIERYSDAMVRHLGCYSQGEDVDPDSGLPHLAHSAWNALAILTLYLDEQREAQKCS